MSQCVPSLDADDNPTAPGISLPFHSSFTAPDVPKSDYEVAEENGQISMHGFGLPQVPAKPATAAAITNSRATEATPSTKDTWEKPRGGTLESIVNQATGLPHRNKALFEAGSGGESNGPELVPWFDPHRADEVAAAAVVSNTMTMDALVPCSNRTDRHSKQVMDSVPRPGTCMIGCSKRVGSCSGAATQENDAVLAVKHARAARVPVAQEWDERDRSVSGSATFGRGSQHMALDTYDKELSMSFTSTGSPENTSSSKQCTKTTTPDDHDSVGHSGPLSEAGDAEDKKKGIGKSSVSTKRSRAADMHNQSERKRRDKINQRMKTLQKLVPNSSKTDKASMLDEVIDYIKQLQAQVQMMNRMNMSPMMLPMALQQQLQMSMMAPMGMGLGMGVGMGMGMGLGMDMNAMNRAAANISGMPPVLSPAAFMPMARWDAFGGDRMQGAPATVVPDLFSTFLACQQQPMAIDAYSRMVAMYQQLQQHSASNSKS